MPVIANAKKALRQSKARAKRNYVVRAQVRTAMKRADKNPEPALLTQLFSIVDKAVKRHVIHKNKAARMKSAAAKRLAAPEKKVEKIKKSAAKKARRPLKKITKKKSSR